MTADSVQDTRFKPGQSGNPKGRPKGALGKKAILERVASERHAVTLEGRAESLSTFQLILRVIRDEALQGNPRAIRAMDDLSAKFGEPEIPEGVGFLIVPERLTVEEWEAEVQGLDEFQAKLKENAG